MDIRVLGVEPLLRQSILAYSNYTPYHFKRYAEKEY